MPVRDGLNQNVLAYFVPATEVHRGDHLSLRYRMSWGDQEPADSVGRVLATRIARRDGVNTYQIDFASLRAGNSAPMPEVSVQGGQAGEPELRPLADGWRLTLPVQYKDGASLTIRASLLATGGVRSETWLYHLGDD